MVHAPVRFGEHGCNAAHDLVGVGFEAPASVLSVDVRQIVRAAEADGDAWSAKAFEFGCHVLRSGDGYREDGNAGLIGEESHARFPLLQALFWTASPFRGNGEDLASFDGFDCLPQCASIDFTALDENTSHGPNDEPEQPVLLIFLSCPTDDIFAAHDAEDQRRIKVAEMIRGQDVCALLWEILLVNYSTPGDEHENKVEEPLEKATGHELRLGRDRAGPIVISG